MMTKQKELNLRYVLCIESDDPDLLTPRMVYQVLPDESAARSGYIRVVDNEGEDYLYPASWFITVEFPKAVEQALSQVLSSASQNLPAD